MNSLVLFASFLALATAQFPPGYLDIPGVTPPPWQGPLSDHVNGIPPKDTAEVAAAKQQLQRAYQEVLSVLPELPPEIRYQPGQSVVPVQQTVQNLGVHHSGFVPQQAQFPQVQHQSGYNPQQFGGQPQPAFMQFAEEVPRSELGEVPEVALARQAHLAAFKAAQNSLPRLMEMYQQHQQPFVPMQPVHQYVQNYNQGPQDTPEVQAAKAQHAAAFAAAG